MYSGQYVLPTEPCDHVQFAVALTTEDIISPLTGVVKGFGKIFLMAGLLAGYYRWRAAGFDSR